VLAPAHPSSLWALRERVIRRFETQYFPETSGAAMTFMPAWLTPIVLLALSNVFMTIAWYGHLKYKSSPLVVVIVVSWAIAFVEYCFAVPANRYGHAVYSAAELKTMQEIITLVVFAAFSVFVLNESLTINHAIGFSLIVAGAFFVFKAPIG
jgi:uncharacterized protein